MLIPNSSGATSEISDLDITDKRRTTVIGERRSAVAVRDLNFGVKK
jgi:hypothetical protein